MAESQGKKVAARRKWLHPVFVGSAAAALIAAAAWTAVHQTGASDGRWYSILPPLLAIGLALTTRRLLLSLAAAVVGGGMLTAATVADHPAGILADVTGVRFLWASIDPRDPTNLLILAYVVGIMAAISVMLAAGGLEGVASWLARGVRSARSARVVTAVAGLVFFIDDYASTVLVGSTFRPMTDRFRVSREKLAFLVDSTAAPIAGLAVISTWIGYEVGLLDEIARQLDFGTDGYSVFFQAIGYRFYCLTMIGFVLFLAATGCDFGPMRSAETRAREFGQLVADGDIPMASEAMNVATDPAARPQAKLAVVPILALLASFLGGMWLAGGGIGRLADDPLAVLRPAAWRAVLSDVDSTILLLALASAVGLASSALLALLLSGLSGRAVLRAIARGAQASLLPVTVLVLAWSLKGVCDALDTGSYLASLLGGRISADWFPALVFLTAGASSFATGTSWGTMAILLPTALPVALAIDGGLYGRVTILSVAAVLDGAIFGDHCSPISDTTIMSSAAANCNHVAHVRTQMPYSLLVAAAALLIGYLPAAMGAPPWIGAAGALAACCLFAALLSRGWRRR